MANIKSFPNQCSNSTSKILFVLIHKIIFYTQYFVPITSDQTFWHAKCIYTPMALEHSRHSRELRHLIIWRPLVPRHQEDNLWSLENLRHSGTHTLKHLSTKKLCYLGIQAPRHSRYLGTGGTLFVRHLKNISSNHSSTKISLVISRLFKFLRFCYRNSTNGLRKPFTLIQLQRKTTDYSLNFMGANL